MSHSGEGTKFCWRMDIPRMFPRYLNGALAPVARTRVERHIFACASCRARLDSLRVLHRSLLQLTQPASATDPDRAFRKAYAAAAVASPLPEYALQAPAGERRMLSRSSYLAVAAALLLVAQLGLLFGYRYHTQTGQASVAPLSGALDSGHFQPVNIRDFGQNKAPDVVTEGYAHNVHVDPEEGTLAFRLVDSSGASRFVVCEISSAVQMNPPPEGSRVKVYGVSRYDAQDGHAWYEINPVLKIAVLRK
jgi:hypothetical protein